MADRQETPANTRRSEQGGPWPWLASIGLHTALIVGAAFVVWRVVEPPEDPPATAISFDAPSYNPTLVPDSALESDTDADAEKTRAIEELLLPDEALAEIEVEVRGLDDFALDPLMAPLAQPEALTVQPPPQLGATFAGLAAGDARDVVYVVDASGSMLTTLPDVLDRLRSSIAGLHPTQRFQVIVFQTISSPDGATTTYSTPPIGAASRTRLLPASSDMKRAVDDWLTKDVRPRGRSNPTGALRAALDLKPDAIFLLSSRITDREGGSFDANALLEWLDGANPIDRKSGRRRVLIQTVQVLDEDPEELLKRIALAHGGPEGFNYISREELTRAKADQPTGANTQPDPDR